MLVLANTTDKIQVINGTTTTIDVHASWVDYISGTMTPGRSNTAITTAATNDVVAAPSSGHFINVKFMTIRNKDAATPSNVTVQYNANGTLIELFKGFLNAGDVLEFHEGIGFYIVAAVINSKLIKELTADDTGGQAVNTVQPWFPTNGTLTVPGAVTYRMKGRLWLTHGATSHSTGIGFGGSATLTSIDYIYKTQRSAANALGTAFSGIGQNNSASNTTVDTAGTAAATYIEIEGTVRINAGGTFIPQFTFSANPTGTITTKRNSSFELVALGDNTFASAGSWA